MRKDANFFNKAAVTNMDRKLSEAELDKSDYMSLVTSADIECQQLISSNLRELYPFAKLVGEEDDNMIDTPVSKLKPDMVRFLAETGNFFPEDKLS